MAKISRRYDNSQILDIDVYANDIQMHSAVTDTQDVPTGKVDDMDGDEQVRKEILSERHNHRPIVSDFTWHNHIQLPRSNVENEYQPQNKHIARWTYQDFRIASIT